MSQLRFSLEEKGELVILEFTGAWLAKLARDVVTKTLTNQNAEAGRLAKTLSYFDDLG